MASKVIITCAITGGFHTPTLSDALPYRPADLARQTIDAAEAGAAILHIHARDPETGAPSGSPDVYAARRTRPPTFPDHRCGPRCSKA